MRKTTQGRLLFLLSVLVVGLASGSRPASAKILWYNVGILAGLDEVTGSTTSQSDLGYGARVGYHFNRRFETGLNYTYTRSSKTQDEVFYRSSLGLLMIDATYHFSPVFYPAYVGIRVGTAQRWLAAQPLDTSAPYSKTKTHFAYGLLGGYDIVIGNNFTVGPRFTYTLILPHAGGVNQGSFQAHLILKYFF